MIFRFGEFTFEASEGLRRDDAEVPLAPRAMGVLAALLEHAGSVVSKQTLMDATWRDTFVIEWFAELTRLVRRPA